MTASLVFLPLLFCTIFQTLFIGVWQFNLETKLRQEVRRFCFNVLQAFALKMRKLQRLSDVGFFPNRRSAFLWFLMVSLQSSLHHGLPGCFGFVEVFGMVLSAYCFVKLRFWIIDISHWVLLCPSVRTEAGQLCKIYIVEVFSHTVEFKLSWIVWRCSLSHWSS